MPRFRDQDGHEITVAADETYVVMTFTWPGRDTTTTRYRMETTHAATDLAEIVEGHLIEAGLVEVAENGGG